MSVPPITSGGSLVPVAIVVSAANASAGRLVGRVRAVVATLGAAALGAAPHVLHHVGPLAGAALLAGATGKLLFGLVGFVLAVPMLRRLHRRHGSWAVPGGVLALMAIVFTFSTLVIGPAVTGSSPDPPSVSSPSGHGSHHP